MTTHARRERPLELSDDVAFQVRINRLQRLGRALLLLVLLGALLGFAGGGLFSRVTAGDPRGHLLVRFDRFARATAPQSLELQIANEEPESEFELRIDAGFLRRIQIDSITPQPREQSVSADGVRLSIDADPPSNLAEVVIRYRALTPGRLRGRFEVGSAKTVLEQFVYP